MRWVVVLATVLLVYVVVVHLGSLGIMLSVFRNPLGWLFCGLGAVANRHQLGPLRGLYLMTASVTGLTLVGLHMLGPVETVPAQVESITPNKKSDWVVNLRTQDGRVLVTGVGADSGLVQGKTVNATVRTLFYSDLGHYSLR